MTADTMDSVATSGVVATMTRKPRERCRSSGEAVVTDLSGNGKKCDVGETEISRRWGYLELDYVGPGLYLCSGLVTFLTLTPTLTCHATPARGFRSAGVGSRQRHTPLALT